MNDTIAKQAIIDALAQTEQRCLCDNDRRQGRLRWLAFYYLSKRELSRYELAQKLKAKSFDNQPFCDDEINPLLDEFAQKGYQCDRRYAQMVVREAIRKQRGIRHIKATLNHAQVNIDDIDALIATSSNDTAPIAATPNNTTMPNTTMPNTTLLDGTALDGDSHINWLKLAVTARTKKYGDKPPDTPKDKAKQLRFLQYRGFNSDICFDALKHTMADFE